MSDIIISIDDVKNICFGGIILLHNSWTPDKYKQMTKNEFLDSNILSPNDSSFISSIFLEPLITNSDAIKDAAPTTKAGAIGSAKAR